MGHSQGFACVEGCEQIATSTFSTQDYATIVIAKHFRKTIEFLVVFIYNQKRRLVNE